MTFPLHWNVIVTYDGELASFSDDSLRLVIETMHNAAQERVAELVRTLQLHTSTLKGVEIKLSVIAHVEENEEYGAAKTSATAVAPDGSYLRGEVSGAFCFPAMIEVQTDENGLEDFIVHITGDLLPNCDLRTDTALAEA